MKRPTFWRRQRQSALLVAWLLVLSAPLVACEPEEPAAKRSKPAPAATPRAAAPEMQQPAHPNLILITLDTTRADALGAYGQPRKLSPNLDRLAARGVLFERVTSASPETLPSHATILTGRWPYTHGVRANAGYVLADRNLTLAEHLRPLGYRSAAEIATRVLSDQTRVTQGFDQTRGPDSPNVELKRIPRRDGGGESFETETRVGADISERGIQFIRQSQNHPFFLWLHYFDAHQPHAPPPMFRRQSPESSYHAAVASLDFQVGRVLAEIERLGLTQRTLVVVTADHGEGLGEHGEDTHAYFVYASTMRVPLIFAGLPQLPPGRRIAASVRTVDIAPTALRLMGLPPMSGAEGVSLDALISGRSDDIALTGYGEAHQLRAVFGLPVLRFIEQGGWKYIHKVEPELYDVVRDPAEQVNLASQHPETVERLRAALAERLRAVPPAPRGARVGVDPEWARQLAALGYVAEAGQPPAASEGESMELSGDDPADRVDDIRALHGAQQRLLEGGDGAEASLEVMERMYSLGQLDAAGLNNYAWALASSPDPKLRDGTRALEVARRALATLNAPDPGYLDTLAAAHAAKGDFAEAVRIEREALRIAESMHADVAILGQLRAHLERFEAGKAL